MRDEDAYENRVWARRAFAVIWVAPLVISLWITAGVWQFIIGWLLIGNIVLLCFVAVDRWYRRQVEEGWVDPIHREDNPYRWKE